MNKRERREALMQRRYKPEHRHPTVFPPTDEEIAAIVKAYIADPKYWPYLKGLWDDKQMTIFRKLDELTEFAINQGWTKE